MSDMLDKMRKRQEALGGTKPRGDQKVSHPADRPAQGQQGPPAPKKPRYPPFRLPRDTTFSCLCLGEEGWEVVMQVPGEPYRMMRGNGIHPLIQKLGQAWHKEQKEKEKISVDAKPESG